MASFSIRSSTLRLGIFVSTLVISAILVYQLVWLKKIYYWEQKEFDKSVLKVIRGIYEDMDVNAYIYSHLNELIENPEPHLYVARFSSPVSQDSLAHFTQRELEYFEIFADCYLGVYDHRTDSYSYTKLLKSAVTLGGHNLKMPHISRSYDYIALYFPNRRNYILGRMNFWIITSGLLLLVLILFGASLYYFYRQRFLNETQKDFIQNFTHEFKTPVSVISLAADVLKNPAIAEKPEKLATYAGIVEYQAAYLKNQTEKLLNYAYTESTHFHVNKERVDIHELIQDAVKNLAPLISERKAVIHLGLDATDPHLVANRDYLTIVIINLVDNAIKYSKNPDITVSTKNTGTRMIVSVRDNGIGIEKKQIRRLFRKFYRVKKEDAYAYKGFGLGLSFVNKIVRLHRGKIRVTSEPGRGSTFTVELPLH